MGMSEGSIMRDRIQEWAVFQHQEMPLGPKDHVDHDRILSKDRIKANLRFRKRAE